MAELVKVEAAGAEALAEAYAAARRTDVPKDLISGLVARFKAAPDGYQKLADSTKKEWARWLDIINTRFGALPVVALKAKGTRRLIIDWRNQFAATPRKADYGVQVLRRVLAWAKDNELAEANPAEGIPNLYDVDRSAEIVEPDEFAAILDRTTPPASRFFRMAAATGLRRGDLRKLQWSHINDTSIEMPTGKSRGRKRIIVPLLPEAKIVLAECREAQRLYTAKAEAKGKPVPLPLFVMTTAAGKQWSKDGPTGAWIKATIPAEGAPRDAPNIDKHLHDLRGNFATLLMATGLSDEMIADMMGWDTDDVKKIRRRYVDRDRIALLISARIAAGRQNVG
ncbi:tyrosine-type recombinase/integrase [Brevundimonas nasdae]|uniref:tyrosine-type recombinase/integrase n=1 Tax=Brevundimonas nasdae TaxID=172043 RepID=UPI003F68E049